MKVINIIISFFFIPLSFLWEWAYRIRRFLYHYDFLKQQFFDVPIISIGNLTFGGTGKTPFTLWLGQYLNNEKKRVMVLMRGYKGRLEHSSGILNSNRRLGFNPLEYGDEALVLARRLDDASIVVGKKRADNLEFYFEKESPDVVLLDDGHQHIQLGRQLNIVLFDALMPIDKYKVAPQGYLREGMHGLRDAGLVVLGRCDQVSEQKREALKSMLKPYMNPNVSFAEIQYGPSGLYNSSYEEVYSIEEMRERKVICVAGIASPESFYNIIESLGADIVDKVSFPDHHFFTSDEINDLLKKAKEEEAYLVTTEKDIVKMKRIVDDEKILYLEIQVEFLSGEKEVRRLVSEALKK